MNFGNIAVHCKTEKEAEGLMIILEGLGIKWWNNGCSPTFSNEWNRYCENTCYNFYNSDKEITLTYSDIDYCKLKGYNIIPFEDFKLQYQEEQAKKEIYIKPTSQTFTISDEEGNTILFVDGNFKSASLDKDNKQLIINY